MLTVKDIERASGIYTIPKRIHVNKHVVIDHRLFKALTNPEDGKDYKYDFDVFLEKYGMNATVRRTLGADIDAACGQLRREYEI